MNVPIKTANQHFTFYKVIVFLRGYLRTSMLNILFIPPILDCHTVSVTTFINSSGLSTLQHE